MKAPFGFESFIKDFFGMGSVPPESVARKVLGIGGTLPLSEEGVRSAFRFRMKLLRPDLGDASLDSFSMRNITPNGEWQPGQELCFAAGSKEEQLTELLWAREDLLGRVPQPVTATAFADPGTVKTRNKRRPVTSLADLSRERNDKRNGRILVELERAIETHKRWVNEGDIPVPRLTARMADEDEYVTGLAVDALLVCSRCVQPLSGAVYLHRVDERPDNLVSDSQVRAKCEACWQQQQAADAESKSPSLQWSQPRMCGCGTTIVCTGDKYRSRGWWYERPAKSCSRPCRRDAANAEARAERQRKRGNRSCDVCGEQFTPARFDARFCSSACRQNAYRKRKVGAA